MRLKRSKSALAYSGWIGKIASALVLPVLVGVFLGNYLDKRLGSGPWITLILLVLGISAGFGWLYRLSSSVKDDE